MEMEMIEEKEKVFIVVLSPTLNKDLININLAMEVIKCIKKNEMPISFSAIVSKKVAENIIKQSNLGIKIDFLGEYDGPTSVCEEIIEICERIKKDRLSNKYILIAQEKLIIPAKKFMDNYGLEMIDVVSISGGDGLRLRFFVLRNIIVEKVKSFLTILNKKQNLPI